MQGLPEHRNELAVPVMTQKPHFSSSHTDNLDNANKSSTSNEARGGTNEGRWSKMEHCNFLKALKDNGRDWKRVARLVMTRTSTQCRSHA